MSKIFDFHQKRAGYSYNLFRLPLPGRLDEELGAVIVEVAEFDDSEPGFQDIPRDRSGPNQAGFRSEK